VNRRGTTLAEMVVALGAAAVILVALHALLLAATRARAREAATREARGTARAAAAILRAELQGTASAAGDLLAVLDTAVAVRAVRAQAPVCAQPAPDRVALDEAHGSWLRSPDPARDAARILLDGDPDDAGDDAWWTAGIIGTGRGTCPDGSPAVTLDLARPLPGPAVAGAPVRVLETVEYRLYRDASGQWMLGTRTRSASGWAATSPLAGPLRPSSGLRVTARDAAGAVAATPGEAVTLELEVRSRSARLAPGAGGMRAGAEDSLSLVVAVGP